MTLTEQKCIPCEGGTRPLSIPEAKKLLTEVPLWALDRSARSISREFTFKNFVAAMDFANRITPIAESEGHHPDLSIRWGSVGVSLSTHAIGGLSRNDFILAAKIDQLTS